MRYKYSGLSSEFRELHPMPRTLILSLDEYVQRQGWPSVMVTHIIRTKKQQEEWYWKRLADGGRATEEIARKAAANKPSLHLWRCALDFSSKIYTKDQVDRILAYLKAGRDTPEWEILYHDIGQGTHFHLGYRDDTWKARWSQALVA
jgi:hypothetical protein